MAPPVAPNLSDLALVALAVHRMLTIDQLRSMLNPGAATTNWSTRLNGLARAGLVRSLPRIQFGPKLWCCTRKGLDQALTDPGQQRRYEVRGSGGTLAAHTWALNEACLAFVRAARPRGDDCDWLSWQHEIAHKAGPGRARRALIVDAVMDYDTLDGRQLRRFVEMDRATEPVAALAAKLRAYATYRAWIPAQGQLAGQHAWRTHYPRWPPACIVIGANPDKDRAAVDRRIDKLLELAAGDRYICGPDPLPVQVCHLEDLIAGGPWAPIWWRLGDATGPVDLTGRRHGADEEAEAS